MTLTIDGKEHTRIEQASQLSGYVPDYLRRLLRRGTIEGVKQGTVWFVGVESLQKYKARMEKLGAEKLFQCRECQFSVFFVLC